MTSGPDDRPSRGEITMVKTLSTMLDLGTPAPDFTLKDVTTGGTISLSSFSEDKALLVMFICRHCPFVKHVQNELARIGADYRPKGLGIVAISSNDIKSHPDDAPATLKEMAAELGFNFPFVFDETQEVAKAYTAACTPDFFLFDAGTEARLSRPARRQPSRERHPRDRPRPAARHRGRARRTPRRRRSGARASAATSNGSRERAQLLCVGDTPLFSKSGQPPAR